MWMWMWMCRKLRLNLFDFSIHVHNVFFCLHDNRNNSGNQLQCQGNKEQKLFKSFPNTTFQPSNCYLFLIHNNLMAKLVIS